MENQNLNLTEKFRELAELEKNRGERFKHLAYAKAIKVLENHPTEIKNGKEALELPGIGKSIALKIDEILETGKLKKIKELNKDPVIKSKKQLLAIQGFGPTSVNKLIEQGYDSVAKIKKAWKDNKLELNNSQILGLKYYKDLEHRIPYNEVKFIGNLIKKEIYELCSEIEVDIAGSFRRNQPSSGDIDILLYSKCLKTANDVSKSKILIDIVSQLKSEKLVIDSIAESKTKFMGYLRLPKKYHEKYSSLVRRIDILLVPYDNYAFSLLYFTGSKHLNEIMRAEAKRQGMKLNEKGITKLVNGKETKIKAYSEKEIFEILGMKYIEPKDREYIK